MAEADTLTNNKETHPDMSRLYLILNAENTASYHLNPVLLLNSKAMCVVFFIECYHNVDFVRIRYRYSRLPYFTMALDTCRFVYVFFKLHGFC